MPLAWDSTAPSRERSIRLRAVRRAPQSPRDRAAASERLACPTQARRLLLARRRPYRFQSAGFETARTIAAAKILGPGNQPRSARHPADRQCEAATLQGHPQGARPVRAIAGRHDPTVATAGLAAFGERAGARVGDRTGDANLLNTRARVGGSESARRIRGRLRICGPGPQHRDQARCCNRPPTPPTACLRRRHSLACSSVLVGVRLRERGHLLG